MKSIIFVLWQEGRYYVAQCLNVDVSSFGETIEEAIDNLKEAVELYLEDKVLFCLKSRKYDWQRRN